MKQPWWLGVRFLSTYRQNSDISHTLVGNEIVDHSDEVGASPVHSSDFIMGAMASQITSPIIVTQPFIQVQIKENIKAVLCAVISPVTGEFPHKWPVTGKMFLFYDVIMRHCSSYIFGLIWTRRKQLQDETKNIWVLGFGAVYNRDLTVTSTKQNHECVVVFAVGCKQDGVAFLAWV